MRRIRGAAAVALVACAALAAGAGSASADVRLQRVGQQFVEPVHVAGAPGDGERLYVVQKNGVVRVVKGGVTTTFADVGDQVEDAGEQGLLSIAFPPDFQTSRLFYLYYTVKGGDANVVAELRAPTGDAADPSSRRIVLTIPHPGPRNHNGGQLQFGPDGMLYLAPGDGGTGGANAHDFSNLLGKLVRIDPHGGVAGSYTVPAGNPWAASDGTRALIWSLGLRNPYRFSFDRATGDLVVGDVGEGTTEELDWLPASGGAGRGADFGWSTCEGSFAQGSATTPCPLAGSVRPILDKPHAGERWQSIIAGYVVRDPTLPTLYGRVVYGDYSKPALRSAIPAAGGATDDRELPGVAISQLTSFGEDAGGCLYVTGGAPTGAVYRVVENDATVPCQPAPPPGGQTPPPPVGDGGGGGGGPSAPGRRAAQLTFNLGWTHAQRVLRNGGTVLNVRCGTACRLTAGATLRIGRGARELPRVRRTAKARQLVRLRIALRPRDRAALRAALRRGGRPTVAVRVRAQPVAGGATVLKQATVRVRR